MKILFQGDSITDAGRSRTAAEANRGLGDGYVNLIAAELTGKAPGRYEIFNRGVGGNRIGELYGRWVEDAVRPTYDLLSVLCGINDVGFEQRLHRGSSPERYEWTYDRMLAEARASHPDAGLVLIAPFVFRFRHHDDLGGEDIYNDWDIWSGAIRQCGEITRKLAEKYDALFIPMFDIFQRACETVDPRLLSVDCIHLRPAGNYLLARSWIDAVTARGWLNG